MDQTTPDNIVSLNSVREMPLVRFEQRLAEIKETFLLSPLAEVMQLLLLKIKKDLSPEGMAILDGTIDVHGNSSCITLYCAEGSLFPEPVTSTAFMTIEQIIELPFDYTTIDEPEELKAFGPRFIDWYGTYGKVEEVGHPFVLLGVYAWNTLVSLDYQTVDYGVRQAQEGDHTVFAFVCQKRDLKFVVEVDYYCLVMMMQQLRAEAIRQNHKFV